MINIKSIPSSGEIGDYVEQFHQMSQEGIIKKAISEVLNKYMVIVLMNLMATLSL